MRDETREILDEIIKQYGEKKLYVMSYIDKDNVEQYTIVSESNTYYESLDKSRDKLQNPDQGINQKDIICRISVSRDNQETSAYIYFRGSYSIDTDFTGVYLYIKEFLALIKSKSRQMNALGIKNKLGMITDKELNDISNTYNENRAEVIERMYPEKSEHRFLNEKIKVTN